MSVEKKIVDDIKNFGWHIINVFHGNEHPAFSYTIGLQKSFGCSELFISGLNGNVASSVLNNIALEVKAGKQLQSRIEYADFFAGYKCYFDLVDKSHYEKYFGKAVWFYQGDNFSVLQCVWPNKIHLYPWQTEMPFNQDILIHTSSQ